MDHASIARTDIALSSVGRTCLACIAALALLNTGFVLAQTARADFGSEQSVSSVTRDVADWVVDSADNEALPFAIVDKVAARVFVFDAKGVLLGASAALVGLAVGDESVPGIGDRPLSSIRPQERTTPAGRFMASIGRGAKGEEVLWVDYAGAVGLHRVVPGTLKDRRLQRLASPLATERRITFGCINVPVAFFERVVLPAFTATRGIVYVLPETRPAREMFIKRPPA